MRNDRCPCPPGRHAGTGACVEGSAVTHVAIVGGGIGGIAAAVFLGRRGHAVTVFERDVRQPGEHLDEDFFDRRRPGVPQAVQPHAPCRPPYATSCAAETPDVYADLLRRGAVERHELDRRHRGGPPPSRAPARRTPGLRTGVGRPGAVGVGGGDGSPAHRSRRSASGGMTRPAARCGAPPVGVRRLAPSRRSVPRHSRGRVPRSGASRRGGGTR
ncbi:NAD(P)-binding protein [Streptomyces argenteolus]|uniref:NAD(P)-binding protein n=1 Tax=Streptomyces argenteolus TaxID=67274 RepID=A0ABW6X425_9ACTN